MNTRPPLQNVPGSEAIPEWLGRYRVAGRLGKGAFGSVYLAEDDVLKRRVAVKVLQRERSDPAAIAGFLEEARILARLDHPGIMVVYDAVELPEAGFCIVSRFIEGPTLSQRLSEGPCTQHEAAQIMAGICEALDHAHRHSVIHRDVKPANIVMSGARRPVLLDFGLARLHAAQMDAGVIAGTPSYMSPEQARGEDHLIDGRSDIFSAGAVFYEMLTGQRAFEGQGQEGILARVTAGDPLPPRRVNPAVARELERICLKALAPRARDRYASAGDMRTDLESWSAAESQTVVLDRSSLDTASGATRVVPRGLRAFDEGDADFFLLLLPGSRDRHGLPESLRFWKQRLEPGGVAAPRLGVIYGPSGCGKSSLVRAGLLPRLDAQVHRVFVEARDTGTAGRLARALREQVAGLPAESGAAALVQAIRQGAGLPPGHRLLLVVDQMEQYLQSRGSGADQDELAAVLRQCDGSRVQALLLVRDDFWRGISQLMADVDEELDGNNSALVDLFDLRHARRVLERFGRAWGTLPEDEAVPLSAEAEAFLDAALAGLAEGNRVIPVRLTLFAEVFKTRPWTPESLRAAGGADGAGVSFLEEMFCGPSASGPRRAQEAAARQVLAALLPASGDIRGPMQPESALREVSGYGARPELFRELMQVLDADLRLLTPAAPGEAPAEGGRLWQLTHDHMVPALRVWLQRRQAGTRQGRAALRLEARAAEWRPRRERRLLPGILEWGQLRCFTVKGRWTRSESEFMAAGRRRTLRTAGLLAVAGILLGFGIREVRGRIHARAVADSITTAPPGEVARLAEAAQPWRQWLTPLLHEAAADFPATAPAGFNARLVLLPEHAADLAALLPEADEASFAVLLPALQQAKKLAPESWQGILADSSANGQRRLRALAALAATAPDGAELPPGDLSWLLSAAAREPSLWADLLRPLATALAPRLRAAIPSAGDTAAAGTACALMAGLRRKDATNLAALAGDFPPEHLPLLLPALRECGATSLVALRPHLQGGNTNAAKLLRAHAALLLAAQGAEADAWPVLERAPDLLARSLFIAACTPALLPAPVLLQRLNTEHDPGRLTALVQCLGNFKLSDLAVLESDRLMAWLRENFKTHPDAGLHSSILWLLQHWRQQEALAALLAELPRSTAPSGGRNWFVTPSGVQMAVITLPGGRQTAISITEVTREEMQSLGVRSGNTPQPVSQSSSIPASGVTWEAAATYCLSLSEKENLPPEQWCYVESGANRYIRLSPAENSLARQGYRLPTEEEWTAFATGGTVTTWFFGDEDALGWRYAWGLENSLGVVRPVASLLPNEAGAFDIMGNVREWTHRFEPTGSAPASSIAGSSYCDRIEQMNKQPMVMTVRQQFDTMTGFRIAKSLDNP